MNRNRATVLTALLATLLISACGGGDGGGSTAVEAKTPPAIRAKANAVCRDFLRETRQLGKGALTNPPSTTLELTTERLVKPSIPLLESAARRMQALEPAAKNPLFDLYANLFDPIIVLAEKRLAAGRAGDAVEAEDIEAALANLGLEQRRAARLVGIDKCDVEYQHVLLSSLSG
jgi:hypothetical protein